MINLRSRRAKVIAAASGVALITSGITLLAPGSAKAETTSANYAIIVPVLTVNGYRAPLYNPSNQLVAKLSAGTDIEVTCYYGGNPPSPYLGDGYLDHVVWVQGIGNFTGHVPDVYVNLGGETPPKYGIPVC
jgi:hypothetical protein